MKRSICLISMLSLAAVAVMLGREVLAADVPQIDLAEWTPPSIGSVGDDPFGKLVKHGYALFTDTPNLIGPAAADPAKRFSGSGLTCQSCHLKAGSQPYAVPLTGVWGQFPQYRAREAQVDTLEDRVNGCLERSMNGHTLPLDAIEMKAYLAYMKWLSTGIPDGAKLIGAGLKGIKEPGRAADLDNGAKVFIDTCAACHGRDGLGQRDAKGIGYQYPPLVGPNSHNNGAGMTRVLVAAAFVRHNMPYGTTFDTPVLSDAEAYDVAAYVNSLERPTKPNLDKDFPNELQKPVDTPYGPYADDFPPEHHKYGPFDPIRAKVRELAAARR
ncbi:MAG TPA: c-type cytochrome [Xanthobacteraceae bacterium]|nr:c-type cytochrome [Xanthobacteraceae bacterium]